MRLPMRLPLISTGHGCESGEGCTGTKLKRDLAIVTRRKVPPSPAAAKFMVLAFKATAV